MYDDGMPHEMFNRLKKLVNKARALGSKKCSDRMLMERLIMAYTPMNYNVVALIRQDPAYKKMTSDDVLGRIMNHEMNIQEANNIKNLYKDVLTSKKQDIALKAKKSKKKKVLIESLSYSVFMPKPCTHRTHDPGSIVPHIWTKVFTDNQMS
jgi:hypothetical protein